MPLTPKQFNMLFTKQDGLEMEKRLVSKSYFDDKMDKLITLIDGLTKAVATSKEEKIVNIGAHDRYDEELNNLKIRLAKIEQHLKIKTKSRT